MKRLSSILAIALAWLATGCIRNDIPYPRIQADFTSFEVDGQTQPSMIDADNRTVTVYLPESSNPYEVKVSDYQLAPEGARVEGGALDGPIDLSRPLTVTLGLYQDYEWTIVAVQDIEREFVVDGQVGTSVIDVNSLTVTALIPDTEPLSAVKVDVMKLGPVDAVMTPDLTGQVVDFTQPVTVDVEAWGHTQTWTIAITTTEANVATVGVDAWTCVAWVRGTAQAGKDNGVEYRMATSSQWIKAPAEWVSHDGGDFTARLIHLQPATAYVARAYSGTERGVSISFTTGVEAQMPNSSMSQWWLDGRVWCPWPKDGERYWDTGNKGAATLGQSNSVPTDDTSTGTGQAAMLQTKFVGIAGIGKLAAGNIFTGEYVRTEGTNGVLSLGREFDQRPTRLVAHIKYKSAPISSAAGSFASMKGQPDTCIVWIALSDAPHQYEIRTNPNNRSLFDPADPTVIAYGTVQSGSDIEQYSKVEVELDYRSTSRVPRWIVVTCSASKYGDYFVGGNGSVLWVDDLRLEYDY